MLGIKEIEEIIPHRHPFLLVDCIEELEPGVRAVGYKCVTFNEPYFQGHFPQEFHAEAGFQEVQFCCVFLTQKKCISFNPLMVTDNHIACVQFSYKIWILSGLNPFNPFTYHTVIHADRPLF